METNFNFKSQICTSREQSQRLLALGLKKETADCYYWQECDQYGDPNGKWHLDILNNDTREHFEYLLNHFEICLHPEDAPFIPAWSLGRLIKDLMPQSIGHLELAVGSDYAGYYEDVYNSESGMYWEYVKETPDMFDNIISTIEWLIKEGYFNKEYLVNQTEIEEHCKGVLEYLDYIRGEEG